MSDVRDIVGPIPRKRKRAYQHLNDIEQYDQYQAELREARQKTAVMKKYVSTFSNLNKYKTHTQHIKARTLAQKPANTTGKNRLHSQMANKKKKFSFTNSQEAGFRDKKRQGHESSSTSAWSSSSDEEDKSKITIPKRQASDSSTSSEDEDNIPDLDDAVEDHSVDEPANSDGNSSHEPSSINNSIFTSCDHAKFEREILQLKEENERLKNTNSKISNSDRELLLLKKLLIAKILVNSSTEDEENLGKLEIGNLFKKYEQCHPAVIKPSSEKTSIDRLIDRIDNLEKTNKKLHSKLSNQPSSTCTSETFENMWEKVIARRDAETKKHEEEVKELQEKLSDSNSKLLLQYSIRDEHDAKNKELMDILSIPDEEKSFHRFKVGLIDLKNDYGNLKEKVEFMEISRL